MVGIGDVAVGKLPSLMGPESGTGARWWSKQVSEQCQAKAAGSWEKEALAGNH